MTASRSHGRGQRVRTRPAGRRAVGGLPGARFAVERPRLFFSTAGFLLVAALFGSGTPGVGPQFWLVAAAGSWLVAAVALEGGGSQLARVPMVPRLLLVALVALPLLQLVPLPPEWWQALPGRALPAQLLDASGQAGWRPMTLSVPGTLLALLYATWMVALVLAVLMLDERGVDRLLALLFAVALVSVLVGMVQFLSRGALLNFHASMYRGSVLGFVANKNHAGLFLVASLLLGYALVLAPDRRPHRAAYLVAVPVALLIVAASVATFSRAALLLVPVALVAVFAIDAIQRPPSRRSLKVAGIAAAAGVLVLLLLARTDLAQRALGRFDTLGEDLRWLFWRGSVPLAQEYWPVGAGFGSFVTAFASREQLVWVKPTYVNHAHNDWLEVVIETGVAGPLVLLALVATVGWGVVRAWRTRGGVPARNALVGAALVLLFALGSAGDYPVRRVGVAVVLFFGLALLMRVLRRDGPAPAEEVRVA